MILGKFMWIAVLIILGTAGVTLSQEKKAATTKMPKEGMQMTDMSKDPHHMVGMAYKENALSFAKALRDMSARGKIEDVSLARTALDEIKRSMDKMDELHKSHMGKMSPEMATKMKPMMDKMLADMAAAKQHVTALETALGTDSPSAGDVHTHAAELADQLEKMGVESKGKM